MRIVAGSHRGRRLVAPPGRGVRPTADRTREALFNILEHGGFVAGGGSPVRGARVLDAFAGTGAMGLEALSRGAESAVFMENGREALDALAHNIAACREDAASQGQPPGLRRISKLSGVNMKELYKLFPKGPGKLAARVSGLPKPKSCI